MPQIFFITKVFDLKLIYVVDTRNVYRNIKWLWKTHFRSWDMKLRNSKIAFPFSQKQWKIVMKFSGMIDLSIALCNGRLSMSAVTSGRHRKWKKFETFKFILLNWNLYFFIRSLFKCPKQLIPPEVETSTFDYFKKKFQILDFSMPYISFND
jgi:hypothetical protein